MIGILSWKSILKQNLLMDMVCAINGAVASREGMHRYSLDLGSVESVLAG